MFQLGKGTSKTRNPPPAPKLPSQTPSQVSLPGIMASGLSSSAPRAPGATVPGSTPGRSAPLLRESKTANAPPTLNLNLPIQLTRGESTRATDRTDALWAEMQATLEEVELSANGGTRVFGPDHERKLGELRVAQIALAQAWARSEADDAIETLGAKPSAVGDGGAGEGAGRSEAGGGTDGGAKSTAGTGSARPGSSGAGAGGQERFSAKLDEETEVDILLARKRREANDRYFKRVNQGVLDVVAKLEEVATAMRAVEAESKDIWGEGEGIVLRGVLVGAYQPVQRVEHFETGVGIEAGHWEASWGTYLRYWNLELSTCRLANAMPFTFSVTGQLVVVEINN